MIAKLVSVAEMVAIERAADAAGHTYAQMMEFAGQGVGEQIEEAYGFLRAEGALGLVGSGNNGGDTLVALAWLAQWGWKTAACLVRPRPADDPLIARLRAAGGEVCALDDDLSGKHVYDRLAGCGVLIDGMQLAQLMIDHDIGVTTARTYTVKKVDQDYFVEDEV
mgnify:CR=1 FL=1